VVERDVFFPKSAKCSQSVPQSVCKIMVFSVVFGVSYMGVKNTFKVVRFGAKIAASHQEAATG